MDFDYKKYSLENLENWMHDAMNGGEASPREIYEVLVRVVKDEMKFHSDALDKSSELLRLLYGHDEVQFQELLKQEGYAWTPKNNQSWSI